MKIDKNYVEKYLDDFGVMERTVEGIPEGFSFFRAVRKQIPESDTVQLGYLMAFTPGAEATKNYAAAYVPVVIPNDAKASREALEFEEQGKKLLELFNKNLNSLKQDTNA